MESFLDWLGLHRGFGPSEHQTTVFKNIRDRMFGPLWGLKTAFILMKKHTSLKKTFSLTLYMIIKKQKREIWSYWLFHTEQVPWRPNDLISHNAYCFVPDCERSLFESIVQVYVISPVRIWSGLC